MTHLEIKFNSGFVALISAIIISVILLLIVVDVGLIGFYGRSNILEFELKERSFTLAESCVDGALLKLANNSNYTGGEVIMISSVDTCVINIFNPVADPVVITTQAIFQNATTHLKIKVHKSDLSSISFEEI